MLKTYKKTEEVTLVSGMVCDCCKKEIPYTDIIEYQEALHLHFTGGYGSVLGDGSTYTCDLCQECVQKLLGPYLVDITDYEK